jgi:lysine-N-methylase
MFLLGILCQRLDNIAHDDIRRAVPAFLRDFEVTIASGTLRIAMETLPTDHARQLDLVLQLAGLLLHRSNISPRFIKCIQAFTQGIGNGPGATLESLTAHYTTAHDHYYAPFFKKNPHILENYLINTIFRCRFPFGRDWVRTGATPSMAREFALLTAQFALMKGLLIGVAGFHREGLSAAHVIHTVQAASKHFEHHTEFLALSHDLLVESRMDSTSGLAILLRNAKSKTPRPTQPAIYAPGPTETTVAFPIRHLPDS